MVFKINVPISERVIVGGEEYPLSFCPTGVLTGFVQPWTKLEVYVIEAKLSWPRCKVGIATDAYDRRACLQVGSPVALSLIKTFPVWRCAIKWVEDCAHQILEAKHSHGEWFKVCPREAISAIQDAMTWLPAYDAFYRQRLHLRPEWMEATRAYGTQSCNVLQNAEAEMQDADSDALMVGLESHHTSRIFE
jgi:hypothetical protein